MRSFSGVIEIFSKKKIFLKKRYEVKQVTPDQIEVRVVYDAALNYVCGERLQDSLKAIGSNTCNLVATLDAKVKGEDELKSGVICDASMIPVNASAVTVLKEAQMNEAPIPRTNLAIAVKVDLGSCRVCDSDGLAFLEKGIKLLELAAKGDNSKFLIKEVVLEEAQPGVKSQIMAKNEFLKEKLAGHKSVSEKGVELSEVAVAETSAASSIEKV